LTQATPAGEQAAKGSALPAPETLGDEHCYFMENDDRKFSCSNEGSAVAWLADGRGACGAHHVYLGRLPAKAKVA
jgi:hypothetical protein